MPGAPSSVLVSFNEVWPFFARHVLFSINFFSCVPIGLDLSLRTRALIRMQTRPRCSRSLTMRFGSAVSFHLPFTNPLSCLCLVFHVSPHVLGARFPVAPPLVAAPYLEPLNYKAKYGALQ